jgi:hypothetical protein
MSARIRSRAPRSAGPGADRTAVLRTCAGADVHRCECLPVRMSGRGRTSRSTLDLGQILRRPPARFRPSAALIRKPCVDIPARQEEVAACFTGVRAARRGRVSPRDLSAGRRGRRRRPPSMSADDSARARDPRARFEPGSWIERSSTNDFVVDGRRHHEVSTQRVSDLPPEQRTRATVAGWPGLSTPTARRTRRAGPRPHLLVAWHADGTCASQAVRRRRRNFSNGRTY